MTLFVSPWIPAHRMAAGWSLIMLIIGMIIVNYAVIITVNWIACRRKMKLSHMKKQWTKIKREHDYVFDRIKKIEAQDKGIPSTMNMRERRKSLRDLQGLAL